MSDPDCDREVWHDVQAAQAARDLATETRHRCPADMPACPVCQEIYDQEDAASDAWWEQEAMKEQEADDAT